MSLPLKDSQRKHNCDDKILKFISTNNVTCRGGMAFLRNRLNRAVAQQNNAKTVIMMFQKQSNSNQLQNQLNQLITIQKLLIYLYVGIVRAKIKTINKVQVIYSDKTYKGRFRITEVNLMRLPASLIEKIKQIIV